MQIWERKKKKKRAIKRIKTSLERGPEAASSSRTRSPVAMWGTPRRLDRRLAYVPLPTPGEPKKTHCMFRSLGSLTERLGLGPNRGLYGEAPWELGSGAMPEYKHRLMRETEESDVNEGFDRRVKAAIEMPKFAERWERDWESWLEVRSVWFYAAQP